MSFQTHKLNENGFAHVKNFKEKIIEVLRYIEKVTPQGRDRACFVTKLEEASFWGTKAIASAPENHTEVINYGAPASKESN